VGIQIRDQYFIGPDNGIFSLIAEDFEYNAFHLTNEKYWLHKRSATFHGRDIFAPAAAHLASGVPIEQLGDPMEQLVTYRWALPIADKDGVQGWVVHIDSYGNLVTNIPADMIDAAGKEKAVRIYVGNTILKEIVTTFGDVPEGEPAAYIGSSDNLEVAINKGNAQQMLGVEKGAQVSIVLQK
jgi:S-adenosylmethionine hydrolase